MSRVIYGGAIALAVVAGATNAVAQSGGGAVLEEVTVTAERGERPLVEVPATVTVIGREEIDRRQIQTIEDLVRYEPGVDVNRITSGTDPFSNFRGFTIRGVGGNRVQIQIDGSRVIESITDGNRDFFDIGIMRSVEIVRGPASVLWGADALGGVVSFRTRMPDDYIRPGRNYGGEVGVSFDSTDNSFIRTAAGAVQTEDRRWQAMAMVTYRTAQEVNLGRARADGGIYGCPRAPQAIRCNQLNLLDLASFNSLGRMVFRPNAEHEIVVTGEIFNRSATVDQRYDLGPAFATNTNNPNGIVNLSFVRDQEQTRYRGMVQHTWRNPLPGIVDQIDWQMSYSPQRRELTGDRFRRLANGQFEAQNQYLDYQEQFWEGRATLRSSFDFLGARHRLTYGFDGDYTRTDYERQDITRNTTTGVTTIARGGGFNFANADTTRLDGFIQDEMSFFDGRLTITPGIRYSTYRISPRPDRDYLIVTGRSPREIAAEELTSRLAGLFWVTPNLGLYAQYSEGFKMPTSQQLFTSLPGVTFNLIPNPDLRPESVRSYEAGIRVRTDNAFLRVGGFYADYTDFIQSLVSVPGTIDITNRNLSSVRIYGLEAAGELRIDRWTLGIALSYQVGDQRIDPLSPQTPFDGVSPFTTVARARYTDPDNRWDAELVGTFAGPVTRASAPNIFRPAGFAVFDALFSWGRPYEDLTLRAGVYNIADTRYFRAPLDFAYVVPPTLDVARVNPLELQTATGRTFRLAATLRF